MWRSALVLESLYFEGEPIPHRMNINPRQYMPRLPRDAGSILQLMRAVARARDELAIIRIQEADGAVRDTVLTRVLSSRSSETCTPI